MSTAENKNMKNTSLPIKVQKTFEESKAAALKLVIKFAH